MRQVSGTDYVDHICRHSPPVINRFFALSGFQLLIAFKGQLDHLLVEFPPVPDRRSQIENLSIIFLYIKAVFPGRMSGDNHILSGNVPDPLFSQPFCRCLFMVDPAPFQIYLYIRVDHPRAHGKSVDICKNPIGGLICNIPQLILSGNGCRYSSHKEFCLIHPCIIRTDRGIGHIYRTVVNLYLRMQNGGSHALIYHLGICCKYHGAAGLN